MMLRVYLLASLLVVAFTDHHENDHHYDDDDDDHLDDHPGCCSQEDRRDAQYMWNSMWSYFTDNRVVIGREIFGQSAFCLISYHHYRHHLSSPYSFSLFC